jgi:O-antigen ligase
MPPALATVLFFGLIILLLAKDHESRADFSPGLWIALIWVAILGSRPISLWVGGGLIVNKVDDYVEGSPLDRLVYLSLIVAGLLVLAGRGFRWSQAISANKVLFLLYGYFAISSLWSIYPGVSFKRCVKDMGNLVIVMVIISEKDPLAAARSVFVLIAYVFTPLSVLFIKYIPEIGRAYSPSGTLNVTGVASSKNELGCALLVCGLFLWLTLLDRRERQREDPAGTPLVLFPLYLTLGMMAWISYRANSMTSLLCFVIGASLLWGLRRPILQSRMQHLGTYMIVVAGFFTFSRVFPSISGVLFKLLNRDPTLTGRTDIWKLVLEEHTNPLIGTGFYSFWLGERVDKFWRLYEFRLNEAHNGYLETYLNNGLIGVGLLLAVLLSSARKMRDSFMNGNHAVAMRLVLVIIGMLYNLSEAAFNRMGLIWFALLLAVAEYPAMVSQQQPSEMSEQLSAEEGDPPGAAFSDLPNS